jgi:nitrite reductase/ring-hydroxylating ferredoxin subunit
MTLHRLEQTEALVPGYRRTFEIAGRLLLLVQSEAGPALVNGICPHAGGKLAEGEIVGNRIRCPHHRFVFDLGTGDCARGRREGWGPLKVYPLQRVDGYLCVDLE